MTLYTAGLPIKTNLTNNWLRIFTALSLIVFTLFSSSLSYASSKTPGKVIAGWVEKITLTPP